MDFLVEFEICMPPDYDPELRTDLIRRERLRAAEISATGTFFKEVWIVPCQRARISICSAADAQELHATLKSLPASGWNKYQFTPLIECETGSSVCMPS